MGAHLVTPGKTLDEPFTGSCECGKVKLEFTEAPFSSFKCHCTICYKFRSMKNLASQDDIDTKQPVVGLFRSHAVRVVEGEEYIEYANTRGACPFFTGVARGYCRECKTPGVIEYFRDLIPYNLMFGDAKFVYLGYVCPDMQHEFSFHHCYDTSTEKARLIAENDGRTKHHPLLGTLRVVWSTFGNRHLLAFLLAICLNPLLWVLIGTNVAAFNQLSSETLTWIFQGYCLLIALFEVPQLINILRGKLVSSFNPFIPPNTQDSTDGRVIWASVMMWFIIPRCFAALYPANRELLQLVAAIHLMEVPLFFFTGFLSKRNKIRAPNLATAPTYTFVLSNPVLFMWLSFKNEHLSSTNFSQDIAQYISVGLVALCTILLIAVAAIVKPPVGVEESSPERITKKRRLKGEECESGHLDQPLNP